MTMQLEPQHRALINAYRTAGLPMFPDRGGQHPVSNSPWGTYSFVAETFHLR
jgi:hypothetical protein